MDPIETYCNLDLGPLRQELLEGVQRESVFTQLELSGSYDTVAGITPNAKTWLKNKVETARENALSAVRRMASGLSLDGGASGFCPPLEADEKARDSAKRLKQETEEYENRNRTLLGQLRENDTRYRQMRNEFGREAKVPSPWLEYGLLLPLVVLPESLLNFGAFRKAPMIDSDFMALGTTLLVAFGVAVAAHFIGLFFRQFNYSWRGDDDARKHDAIRQLMIGLVTLLVCLAVVGAARYYYVLPKIQQAIVLGTTPPNLFFSVASMLFGNLLCFLIGAACTFALHDKNPDYEDTARALRVQQKQADALRRKQLDPKVKEIARRQASDRSDIERKTRTMQAQPDYPGVVGELERILAKDREVESLMHDYASQLGSALEAKQPRFQFSIKDYSGGTLSTRTLSISEYMNHPIQLLRK